MPPRVVARPFYRPPTEELRYLPECPTQLSGTNRLGWVAIQHGPDAHEGSLNVLNLVTLESRTYPLPGRPGFFVETADPDVLIIGIERRLVRFDLGSGTITATLAELPDDPRVIINDGIAVPDGVIFGTKHLEFSQPIAALYHYGLTLRQLPPLPIPAAPGGEVSHALPARPAPRLAVREIRGGQTCSNGKYFQDGRLIDIDTQPKTITEYRYHENGPLERLRLITPPDRLPALPDGLRATPDGTCIVVAYYNPAAVADGLAQQIRITDGEVIAEWTIPGSPRVTCPEFVTLDGRTRLLFTTAVEGMPPEIRAIAPEAGTMFIAEI